MSPNEANVVSKPSAADQVDALNLEVTRDLLNRVKYHRGSALRGPELHNLLPKVTDKFAKHGALLFPK